MELFQQLAADQGGYLQIVAARLDAGRRPLKGIGRQEQFPRREQQQFLQGLEGALGERLEAPDGIDEVAEEFDPHRQIEARWEDVDDAAPHGKGPPVLHQRHVEVAEGHEPGQELVPVALFAGQEVE